MNREQLTAVREKRGRGRAKSRWIAAVTVDYPAIEYEQCLPRSPRTHARAAGTLVHTGSRRSSGREAGETSPVAILAVNKSKFPNLTMANRE